MMEQIDWTHFLTVGVALLLIKLIEFLSRPHPRKATMQPLSTAVKTAPLKDVASPPQQKWFGGLGMLRALRWLLFVVAVIIVLIGFQDMYAALNPPGYFVRDVFIHRDPEISWAGAALSAAGFAILWFGRQWWTQKLPTQK